MCAKYIIPKYHTPSLLTEMIHVAMVLTVNSRFNKHCGQKALKRTRLDCKEAWVMLFGCLFSVRRMRIYTIFVVMTHF